MRHAECSAEGVKSKAEHLRDNNGVAEETIASLYNLGRLYTISGTASFLKAMFSVRVTDRPSQADSNRRYGLAV